MKLAVLVPIALPLLFAQTPNSPTIPKLPDVNPELLQLVIYDQWDRVMTCSGTITERPMIQ